MKKITIEIDCGDRKCEECRFMSSPDAEGRMNCGIFYVYLGNKEHGDSYRCYDCVAAEDRE
jgi:hypothetical protein